MGYFQASDLPFHFALANAFTIPPATVNWIADVAVETLSNYSAR